MSWFLDSNDILLRSNREVYDGRYYKAEYIEFDTSVGGAAFIDTGITDGSDTNYGISFMFVTLSDENWITGVTDSDTNVYVAYTGVSQASSFWYSFYNNRRYTEYSSYPPRTDYWFFSEKYDISITGGNAYTIPYHIIIGGRNWASSAAPINYSNSNNAHFKINYFFIKKNGTYVMEMYPAYDPVNEEWGMYDVIGKQFHGNAGAEGTYIYGGYYTPESEIYTQTPEVLAFDYDDPPVSMWYINDEIIVNGLIPDRLKWQRPYPYSMWFIDHEDNDIIINELLPDILEVPPAGAFTDCKNLRYVRIPKSVKSIGPMAFNGTDLKIVCLSRRCNFSYSSFPSDCKIIYYEDIYPIDYDMLVAGVNAYRITDTIARDEELPTWEIP